MVSITMMRLPRLLGSLALLVAVGSAGCAAPAEEDAETGDSAFTGDETIRFDVVAFATETKTADYGTHERIFGTARADDRMKEEMLPRVRAQAAASLAASCSAVTRGAGHVDGAPRQELVRAERIYRVTEFVVEVSNVQTCVAPRAGMEARAKELVESLADKGHDGSVFHAVVALGDVAVGPTLDHLASFLTPDGHLDMSREAAHGNANWTVNHVGYIVNVLVELHPHDVRAIPMLQKLKAAYAGMNGASYFQDQIDRAIAKISA